MFPLSALSRVVLGLGLLVSGAATGWTAARQSESYVDSPRHSAAGSWALLDVAPNRNDTFQLNITTFSDDGTVTVFLVDGTTCVGSWTAVDATTVSFNASPAEAALYNDLGQQRFSQDPSCRGTV